MNNTCPICQTDKHMHRTKNLYGVPICKKCYYRFANKRQLAYFVDSLLWLPIAIVLALPVAFYSKYYKQAKQR